MEDGTDFAQQTPTVNVIDDTFITEVMRLICYNQPIYDDDCVELDEYAGLTLGVIDNNNIMTTVLTNVRPMYGQASILIVHNDSESMTVNVCGDVITSGINLYSTPVATVGLEETFYSTPEDGGAVEVCVVVYMPDIDCPICFPFNVSLSTRDFSAGLPRHKYLYSFSLHQHRGSLGLCCSCANNCSVQCMPEKELH